MTEPKFHKSRRWGHGGGISVSVGDGCAGGTTTVTVVVMVLLTVMVVAGAVDVTRVVLGVMPRQEQALEMREAG